MEVDFRGEDLGHLSGHRIRNARLIGSSKKRAADGAAGQTGLALQRDELAAYAETAALGLDAQAGEVRGCGVGALGRQS
jgi:hypothetical protein